MGRRSEEEGGDKVRQDSWLFFSHHEPTKTLVRRRLRPWTHRCCESSSSIPRPWPETSSRACERCRPEGRPKDRWGRGVRRTPTRGRRSRREGVTGSGSAWAESSRARDGIEGACFPARPSSPPDDKKKNTQYSSSSLVKRPPIYKKRRKRARARRTGSSASVRPPASSEVVHVSRLSPAGRALPPFSSTSIVNWGELRRGGTREHPGQGSLGNFDGEEGCYIISCMLWSVCLWCDAAPTSLDCSPPRSLLISLRASRIHPVTRVATSSATQHFSLSLSLLLYSHTTTALECC